MVAAIITTHDYAATLRHEIRFSMRHIIDIFAAITLILFAFLSGLFIEAAYAAALHADEPLLRCRLTLDALPLALPLLIYHFDYFDGFSLR